MTTTKKTHYERYNAGHIFSQAALLSREPYVETPLSFSSPLFSFDA